MPKRIVGDCEECGKEDVEIEFKELDKIDLNLENKWVCDNCFAKLSKK